MAASRIEYVNFTEAYAHTSPGADQEKHRALEAGTSRIRAYQPAMIPGLLQTSAYAREALSIPTGPAYFGASRADLEAMVHARLRRQDVLYDQAKQVQLVVGEAALCTTFGSVEVLRGQLDRLASLTELGTVEVGIIPFTAAAPIYPLSGFDLHHDGVYVETLAGEQTLDDPADVALYTAAFDQLQDAATTGADAAQLIRRVLSDLTP